MSKYLGKFNYEQIKKIFLSVVKDIELKSDLYGCFPYPSTIRSILIASSNSPLAKYFVDSEFYGTFENLSLKGVIFCLEELCRKGDLESYFYENKHGQVKKRYRSKVEDNTTIEDLSSEELEEIKKLLEE